MANTIFNYLYRDSSNYKTFNRIILTGEMSPEDFSRIQRSCDCGEYFIPAQVGLDALRNWDYDPEVDHPWFEIMGYEPTQDPATSMTVQDLVSAFERCAGKWDPE